MKEIKIEVPVLVIGFNRPEVIRQSFEFVRQAQPAKLYVAIDGPRADKEGEADLVEDVKAIVQKIDWECETHYRFHTENKGAEITVSSAIAWVLKQEEYVIVLEDDIIAPLSFFNFMQAMLIKYKDEPNICMVSGCNGTPLSTPNNIDYFFAKYGHSWGWGTWRRVWQNFDLNVEIKKEHLKLKFLKTITNTTKEARYYKKLFSRMRKRGIGNNTWDFMFLYINRVANKLAILPRVHLTSNIGIYGLHAKGATAVHNMSYDETFSVQKHPSTIEYWKEYDMHHFNTYIYHSTPLYKRLWNKGIRIINSLCNKHV
ncbi:MAG: hypothetical protein M0P77_09055 [Firmicutes bacterium]|nr:hypothetical protein [Bacillota bacterium]